jgi:hypothetical protein
MWTQRSEFWVPTELIELNKEKNSNEVNEQTSQEKITICSLKAIHETIHNNDDFVYAPMSIPWYIGVSKTIADTLEA